MQFKKRNNLEIETKFLEGGVVLTEDFFYGISFKNSDNF